MAFMIYLLSVIGNIGEFFTIISIFSGIAFAIISIIVAVEKEDILILHKFWLDIHKKTKIFWFALLFSMLAVFIPSTKTMVAMFVIPSIVESENVKQLPANLVKFLDAYTEDLKSDSK